METLYIVKDKSGRGFRPQQHDRSSVLELLEYLGATDDDGEPITDDNLDEVLPEGAELDLGGTTILAVRT